MRDKIVRNISKTPICGIYQIMNNINGKIYIGQSIDIERRWNQHKYGKGSIILKNAIKKYGVDNFSFMILEEIPYTNKNDVIKRLTILEQKWLDDKKPFLRGNGYNQNKSSKPNIPIKRPEGYGEIISKIKIDNNHTGKPIKQYDLDGNLIKEWPSSASVERELGFKAENIGGCCLRKTKTSNGYIWRFKSDTITDDDLKKINTRAKPIIRKFKQLTLDGELVREWDSFKQLCGNTVFDNRPVKKCCNNERDSYKGFKWVWST